MWIILEHKSVAKALEAVPQQIVEKYELWKNIVRHSGPNGLRVIKGFNDEALSGNWRGYRSSRLSQHYRVIYKADGDQLSVTVERVTKHDYRS